MSDSIHPVRAYRLAQQPKLPLKDLAEDVGVKAPTLSRIETGVLPLTVPLAMKLSRRTGIPMAVLCPDLAPMFQGEQPAAEPAQ